MNKRFQNQMKTTKIIKLLFSALFLLSTMSNAQNLTISSTGQTGTSGTNWSILDNVLYIGNSGSASINTSVITNHLQSTGDLIINLPGQSNVARNININNTIAYSGSVARTLTFQSGNDIVFANAVGITSATASLNVVLRSATTTGTPDNGSVKMDGINIDTKGGHLWVGGGATTTTWNGLSVGNSSVRTYLDDVAGISLVGSTIASGGGNIYMYGQSFNSTDDDGVNYGINVENSNVSSGSGAIYFKADINGRYTNGIGMRVIGTTAITSTSGAISILGYGYDGTSNGNSWRLATSIQGSAQIKSVSGAITVIGDAAFTATVNDKEGLMIAAGATICSQTGNISLRGTNTLESSGQFSNSIRFAAADVANSIRIGYDGTNAYSGNITMEGNSIYQRYTHLGAGSIAVQTTGTLTIQPTGNAFTYMRAANSDPLTYDNDWNFGTTLGGFVYGKTTNTTALTYSNALTTNGPITMYAGTLTQNGAVSSSGAITFNSTDFTLGDGINVSTSTASDITINANGNFGTSGSTRRTISSANGSIIIHADKDANGSGTLDLDYLTFNPGTGATIIRGETVSFVPGSASGPYINGTGSFTFQPSDASFTPTVNTSWFEIDQDNNGIGGLTLGKAGNTADILQNRTLTIAGPVNMYGGGINISQNLTSTLFDADIFLQATGAINMSASTTIQSNGGDVTLRSNSGGTAISTASSIVLNSGSTIASQGGNITLGGNFTGAQGAGLYATSTNAPAISIDGGIISAAGGNIKLYGKCSTSYDDGIRLRGTINTIGSGTVELYGEAYGGNNGTDYFGGITFGSSAGSTIETENGNLILNGFLTNTQSNSTGAINFYRNDGSTGQTRHINLLSKTGNITVTADIGTTGAYGIGHSSWGNVYVGSPASGWTASGNVVFNYSRLVNAGYNGIKVKTTGAVTYQPIGLSFTAAQTFPANSNYILADNASSLTIGKSSNTSSVTIASAQSIAGPISVYAGDISVSDDLTSTAGGDITLKASNGFYTSGSGSIQRDITTSGGNILVEADSDSNGSGTLNLDYMLMNAGSGTTTIRGELMNFDTANDTQRPWINGTGVATIESNDASFGQEIQLYWFKLATGLGGLNFGKTTNTVNMYFNSATALSFVGPVNVTGAAVTFSTALTVTNDNLFIKASGAVTQTAAITANGLALNGTGTFALTNTSNNFATVAGGVVGGLLSTTQVTDASGGLIIGTVGSNTGIMGSGTIRVETLASDLTLASNISTTSTSTDAVILTSAKNTAIGVGTGGDVIISGTPTITMGTGGIAKLFSGYDVTSSGLTNLVGGASNVRNTYDETSTTFNPVLSANNKYAIYRTAFGYGDLTIVSSGGDAEGTTWTYANGVIKTTNGAANVLNTVVQTKLNSANLSIEANKIIFNANVTGTTSNALNIRSKTHIVNSSATTITTAGGDVLFATNVDDATDNESIDNGYIQFENGLTVTTNGGNITLGGGDAAASSYALGASTARYEGIRVAGILNLNSGGGNVIMRGKSYNINTGSDAWGLGFMSLTTGSINSGTGTVLLDGYSQSGGGTRSSGLFSNGNLAITSANTTADAIKFIGKSTGTYGESWGVEAENALSLIATGEGGGITMSSSQQNTAANHDVVLRGETNILAKSGPINLLGGQSGGIANGYLWLSGDDYIGSKASSAVTSSSSNITIQYDYYSWNGGSRYVATSGTVNWKPVSASFYSDVYVNWFNWNQNGQTMTGFTVGKPGCANWLYHQTNAITVAGPISYYGGYVAVSGNLTSSANGDILLKGIYGGNDVEVSSTISKTAGTGTLTMQAHGRVTTSGAITASGTGVLNVVMWTDFDNDNNDGGAGFAGTITTNGGHVWLGGSNTNGGSCTWNGLTVGDGPSIGYNGYNANALDLFNNVTTNGGDFFAWAGNGAGGTNGIASNGTRVINTGSGDITFISPSTSGAIQLTTTGQISLAPNGGSYPSALTLGGTASSGNYTFNTGLYNGLTLNNTNAISGLTIGRNTELLNSGSAVTMGNTSDITLSSALDFGGDVSLYGGNIAVNAALTATNKNITLYTTGAATQTGAITAKNLELSGSGTFTLTNTSNNVGTIAGGTSSAKLGSISYIDSNALTIGALTNPGIIASGKINIQTLTNNLTLSNNVATDNTTTDAIILNAGKSADIGSITGGDIIVSGTPSVTTGTNGIAKLFSGTKGNSTGLSSFVGGNSNTRYYYDENSTSFSPVLVNGNKYAVYRYNDLPPANCLNFDGTNDYAQIPYYDTFAGNFTVETWIKTTSSLSRSEIVSWGNSSTSIGSVGEFRLVSGKLQILCNGATGNGNVTSNASVNTGKWIHVAVVKNGTTYSLYINGVLDGSSTIAYSGYNFNTMTVGGLYYNGAWSTDAYFPGNMDEMRFWNTARTQSQIETNMYNEISASATGLVHYYNFNNSGSTLTDSVTTGTSNGTLTNFALTGTTSNWVESYAMVVPTAPNTTAITTAGFTANWTAPVPGIVENYLLDVATDAAFTSFVSGYNAKNIGTVTSYTVTGLEQGTTFYWRVRAEKATVTGQAGYTAVQTVATPQEALNLSSTTTTNTLNLLTNSAVTVDPNVAINYTHNITGFSVVLSNGKQNGDVLSYTGTLPSGISATAYNSATGVLSFTGTTTAANWQTLLRTVTFRAYTNAGVNRSISFSAGTLNSFTNGHYYELVSTLDTWTNSKTAASNKKYLNYKGYLATVTSQAENDYIKQILTANAWMGATDEYSQINLATGATTYANQSASEGKWYWVTGPEAGNQFASSNSSATPVSGRFNNWYAGEPNNTSGTEHFGQFFSTNNGTWNDLPNSSTIGYVVEYGGMATDIVQTPSYSLTMSVSGTPPGNALSFDGTNDFIYTSTQVANPTTFTLEAWFNTSAAKSGGIVGFNADQTNALTSSYDRFIWMSSDGKINFSTHNGNSNTITSAIAYNDGKYHHVAGSYSSATGMKLYIDGVLIGTNPVSSISNYSGYWKIGGFRDWANYGGVAGAMDYFNGKIDEVRIWSTVRTQAEVQSNMLNVIAPTTTGLSYYYNFDQGNPSGTNTGNTTLFDQTSSANNGTLSGFAQSNTASNWVESYAMVVPQPATTSAITSSGFTANWGASVVGTFNNYILDVSTNAGFTSFVSGFNNKNVGTSTSFAVTGLAPFTTYYWRVRADKTSVTGQGGYTPQTLLTSKEPINITSTTTTNTFNLLTNSAIVVDPNLAVNYSQNIDGFRVIITTNKQDGDILAYTGTLPSGITPVAYNAATGVLAFTGSTSAANWQTFLRTVTFRAYKNSTVTRSISFSAGTLNSFSNGHFYELVSTASSWTDAKAAAAAKNYLNYTGYLATVTSQAENDYIKQILTANAWMGASDDYSFINAATGATTYANQGASEGKWYWVTGPEAGTQFMTANSASAVVAGKYANWYSGEPNNSGGSEHYGQFYSANNGTWNDLPNSYSIGYVVEYGGLASDIVQTPSYSVTMNVAAVEPGNALDFDGTNDYVNLGTTLSFPNSTPFTIEAWVNRKTAGGGFVVSKHNGGVAGQYTVTVFTNGTVNFGRDVAPWNLTTTTAIPENRWSHIAATYNGTTMTIYINGIASGSMASGSVGSSANPNLFIGAKETNNVASNFFGGKIDEVRFWSVARSQAEIVANMNAPVAPSTANLLSYYNFNEGITNGTNTGLTTIYDQTTTLNNGTLNGFGLSGSTTNWVESYAMVVPTTIAATSKYSLGFTANWTASTIGTTEKYYLDVATDAAFTSLVSGYSGKDVGTVTSFAVNTGLTANTTYYYRVRAEKTSVTGTGANSNVTSVTTNVTETLVATAASDRTSTSFKANWTAPTIHNISAYLLDVSTVSNFATFVSGYNGLSVSGLSQTVSGLTPNTTYYYRIRVAGYNNSNTITTNTNAPFAAIATSAAAVCLNGSSPIITFTGSGSAAPYTFTYTLNGGSNQTIATTSGNSVTLAVPTSSAGTNTYSLVNVTDANSGTNPQSGSAIVAVNVVPAPSFVTTPDVTICSNVDVTYSTESGQTNYVWSVPGVLGTDYTITSGGTGTSSATVALKWLTSGNKTVTVNYTNSSSCTGTQASTSSTVNSAPTVASITGTTTTTVGLSTTLSNTTLGGVWSSSNESIASINSSGLVTAIDQGTATITYTVTSGSCTSSATTTYTVNAAPTPTITNVSPALAVVGATITITGTNFSGASLVTIGSYQPVFTVVSSTSISVTIPEGTGSNLAIAVTTPGGTVTSTSPNLFTFNSAGVPTITSFTPTSAGSGQTVVITGTNLTNPSSITFGGTDVASYTVNSATQITVVIGSGTSGSASVTTPGGTGTKTGFTFLTCSGNPTLYAGGSLSMCTSESPVNITNTSNASNYTALLWSTSGTGTFSNNTTDNALSTTTYSPSAADIAAGVVTLTLTATANSGCTDVTDTKLVKIYATPIGGSIAGGTSVCLGTNSTSLTLNDSSGDISNWQSSTTSDFSSNVTDIAGTKSSLTVSNITETTYYRAVLTNGTCAAVNSSSATIAVDAVSVGGNISGSTTVCSGTNSTALTLSTYTGSVLKWQSSTTSDFSSNVTDIENTTASLTALNLTTTTYYRAVVANGSCSSANSSNATVTVDAVSVAGSISGSTTVCTGTNSTVLTLNDNVGNVTKWQSSTLSDFASSVTDIANTTTSLTATNLTATTYYRAVVTSGVCSSATTDSVTMTVSPTSVAGSITGATTVCTGTNSTVLTLGSNTGSVTKWQYSSDNFASDVHDVANTTTSLTATNLTATTNYRAVVTSGVCSSATTSAVTMTVSPVSVAGSIEGVTAVCIGTNSTVLTLSGNTGSIQWQSSPNNSTFGTISGATSTTYTPTNLTATTYYKAVVTSGACSTVSTDSVTMTVSPTSVAGIITGATTVCTGTNSTVLTLGNNTGNVSKWQYSSDNFASDVHDVANTTTSLTATNLTATTYYRAVVTSGACSSATTLAVTMTVSPTSFGGSVIGGTTVCSGTNSTALSLTGITGNVTKWQSSSTSNFASSTDIANTTTSLTATNLTATKYYRAVVTSGACSSVNSDSAIVTVSPTSVGGSISGDATVCSGTNSTDLSISGYTGTVVKWQSSTSSNFSSAVTDIDNTTTTLTAINVTTTTYYRAVVASGSCTSANSATATIMAAASVGGYTIGSTSMCSGTNSATLTLRGNIGSITKWQSSTTSDFSSEVTDIANSSANLTATNLTTTTYYRAVVQSGSCDIANSENATLLISPASFGGTLSGSTTLMTGVNSATLNLTGNAGDVIKWQSSSVSDFSSNVSDIANITTSLTVNNLNATTYYRAVVASGNCPTANSAVATITITSSGAGTVSGGTTLCSATNSTTLTLSDTSGNAVKWQSSPVSNFASGVVDIANTTNSLIVTNLTSTKYYRALISFNGSTTQYSSSVSTIVYANVSLSIQEIYGPADLCGLFSATYGVPAIAGATKYIWTFPAGISVRSSAGNEVVVNIDPLYVNGTISVRAINDCPGINSGTKSISPYKLPFITSITGPTSSGALTTATYTATALQNATYRWTVPVGMTITSASQTTNSIDVAIEANFTGGSLSCIATNSCGISNKSTLSVSAAIVAAPIINLSGPFYVCGSTTATYTVASALTTSLYNWSVPSGVTITSGQNTKTIVVTIDPAFAGGEISVSLNYSNYIAPDGSSVNGTTTKKATLVLVQTPGAITGPKALCGLGEITYDTAGNILDTSGGLAYYSVAAVNGAINYIWTVPTGATIISGQGTSRVGVSFNYSIFSSGTISVQTQSTCGTSAMSNLIVKRLGGSIIGLTELCNVSTARYYLPFTTGSSFNWTVPSWMTITSGQGTSDITVSITGSPCSDTVKIDFTSNCNTAENFVLTVGCSQSSKLLSGFCGITVASENSNLFANTVTGATMYKFKVSDGSQTQYIEKNAPSFTLSNFTGWSYGNTYSVSVAPKVNGSYLDYGCSCSVTLSSPKSKLVSSVCGVTLTSFYASLNANAINGATSYKFEVTNGANVRTYTSSTNSFNLMQLTDGVIPSTTYSVKVDALYNGSWLGYGTACNVTTPGVSSTKLVSSNCGSTISSLFTPLNADIVAFATGYRFEVSNGGTSRTYDSASNVFNLMQLTDGAQYNTTYAIRVATLYNGVYQAYGISCNVTTQAAATTSLVSSACGVTLTSLYAPLYANAVALATGYRFEVSSGGTTRTFNATSNVFNLMQLTYGAQYNTTYSIRVAALYNGVYQAYGTSCNVTTPILVPTTTLVSSVCGSTLTSLFAPIYANAITLASGYRFEVSSGGVTRIYDTTSNLFNLMQLTNGATYGTTYAIRVALLYNGTYQAYGTSCNVSTQSIGNSQVVASRCGTVLTSLSAPIYANAVSLATGYKFEVRNAGTGVLLGTTTDLATSNMFTLKQIAGTGVNTAYSIRVALQYNGTWQAYGPSCTVTTAANAATRIDDDNFNATVFNVKGYPNPFADNFTLAIESSSDDQIEVKVYDMIGRLIEARIATVSELNTQEIGNNYPSGVYNVIVVQGQNEKLLRMVKR